MSDPAQCPHDFYRRAEYRCVDCESAELKALEDRIKSLEREVEMLRRYGNKDCTRMADAALTNPDYMPENK
jgi:hypothetical protein